MFVLRHIKDGIEGGQEQLPDLYDDFGITLTKIAVASTPELQQELKGYKEQIVAAHNKLEPSGWSFSQLHIYETFGAKGVVGLEGTAAFDKALTENAANTPGAVTALKALQTQITKLQTDTNNVLNSLGGLAKEDVVPNGQEVVQIVFDKDVAINDFNDLAKLSEEWKQIIRAYCLLVGEQPENIKIIASNKTNPYSFWLAAAPLFAKAIHDTIDPFLEIYKKVLEAREKSLALESMKVDVDGKKFALFETIDEWSRKRV